jgi:hypothetical protein
MNPNTANLVLELISIGERALQAAAEMRAQSQLADADLLAAAESKDQATRDQAQKFLASLAAAPSTSAPTVQG